MGLLYTTEGTRRVIDTLNTAFDYGPNIGLAYIREQLRTDPSLQSFVRNRNWQLARFAFVFQIYPADQKLTNPGNVVPREKARWHWFLKQFLGRDQRRLHNLIRDALTDAMDNPSLSIVRVTFDHIESSVSTNPDVVIFDAPLPGTTGRVRNITLITVKVAESEPGTDFDPPGMGEPRPRTPPWRHT